MPKGIRYQRTINGVKYDFSKEQFEMLSMKSLRFHLPLDWKIEVRIKSLRIKGLFEEKSQSRNFISYKRTSKGGEVFKAISEKL